MGLSIDFLKAAFGDSILITHTRTSSTTRILIDGGPPSAFTANKPGNLKAALEDIKSTGGVIDLVVLTHVDDDHIGGLLKAFSHDDFLPSMAKAVLFNSGQLIYEHFEGITEKQNDIFQGFDTSELTSIGQGISFEKYILDYDVWDRRLVHQGLDITIDDIKLEILSPSFEDLKKLLYKWDEKQEFVLELTSAGEKDYDLTYEQLLVNDNFKEDESVSNGSSISFILTLDGKKMLFLGDAHPSSVISGLRTRGYRKNNKLKVEFVKLSHHGSKANTSLELLELVDTKDYIVLTDGTRHGLPNKKTFARIHNINPEAALHFNYGYLIEEIYSKEEMLILGEKLKSLDEGMKFE